MLPITTVKVFSATGPGARETLGDRVTAYLADNPGLMPIDTVITQSSDRAHHAICITMFLGATKGAVGR